MGREGFEPPKNEVRQIYSLVHLTTLPPARTRRRKLSSRRDLNPQPPVYKTGALPIELRERKVLPRIVHYRRNRTLRQVNRRGWAARPGLSYLPSYFVDSPTPNWVR